MVYFPSIDAKNFYKGIALTCFGGLGTAYVLNSALAWRRRRRLAKRAKEYFLEVSRDLSDLENRLKSGKVTIERRNEICSLSLEQLSQQLKSGKIKPLDVLESYQAKALEAHKQTNCLVGVVKNAETLAQGLEGATQKGPLYGLPISLKENYRIEGHTSTYGLCKNIDLPITEDCVLVKVLKFQGAVPFIRTNMPQSGMSLGCGNPIFGATRHPLDASRTSGGSSGGEGSLIALGGSPLGFGSDIGGSIRCPAAFCGLTGLRPTDGRLSKKGLPSYPGQTAVRTVFGPMARDVDSLVLIMKALCIPYMHELDPSIAPLPFNNDIFENQRPLRIGYYTYDGYIRATPACERAVLMAKSALEKQGHTLVPWQPPRQGDVIYMTFRVFNGDAGENVILKNVKDEKIDLSISELVKYCSYPSWWRKILTAFTNLVNPRLAKWINAYEGTGSTAAWWKLVADIDGYRNEFLEAWRAHSLDAVICPPYPYPATNLNYQGKLWRSGTYLVTFNLANCPSGVVPVTKVTKEDIERLTQGGPVADDLYNFARQDSKGSEGLPVGVQCATLTYEEELCLRVMKDVENGFKQ